MIPKNKNSHLDLKKDNFSNFVVDLRSPQDDLLASPKKKRRNWRQILVTLLGRLGFVVHKIKPNLLTTEPSLTRQSFSSTIIKQQSQLFFSWLKRELISLNLLKSQRSLKLKKRPENYWSQFIRKQEQIFNQSALNNHRSRKFISKFKKVSSSKTSKKFWWSPRLFFILALVCIVLFFQILLGWPLNSFGNLEHRVIGHSNLALNNLMKAGSLASQLKFQQASSNFQQASTNFLTASHSLDQINNNLLFLASLSTNPQIKLIADSKNFLKAGTETADLGNNLVLASQTLFNSHQDNFPKTLDKFLFYTHHALHNAQNLQQTIKQIDVQNLPSNYRLKFVSLQKQVNLLTDNLNNFVQVGDQLKTILGMSRDKRYLLVFQNNAELRASGGFLGSYALVDLSAGRITNLEVPAGGSYDTAGAMQVRVVAPQPLWLVNPLWHFWDANWWPDWPTTAQNLMWFYERSGGSSVDGVISITPTVVARLLKITGPIDLRSQYGVVIDANNFWETVQTISERKNLAKTNPQALRGLLTDSQALQTTLPLRQGLSTNSQHKPKKIIGDLMAKILEVLPQKLTKNNLLKIISIFQQDLSEKQILFYFTNPKLEALAVRNNWAGKIRQTTGDYLLVVNTNIAGQKTDRVISQKINESSIVQSDGSIIDTLQIIRTHHGRKGTPFTGVRNVDWLRVYVPAGSKLISASGFQSPASKYLQQKPNPNWTLSPLLASERAASTDAQTGTKIYQESGKTVFANWSILDPGQQAVITLRYRLPFNFFNSRLSTANSSWLEKLSNWLNPNFTSPLSYSLMVQKQPGALASSFNSQLVVPKKWFVFWRYPQKLLGYNGWHIKNQLDADQYYVVLLKKTTKP